MSIEYYDIAMRIIRGYDLHGKSISYQNKVVLKNIKEKESVANFLVGVKNNGRIPREILLKIFQKNYYFHTLDMSADRGRATDMDLINPLTGGKMTGSSSGTALNVLYGVNHLGIGSDGGGSVIYPAMSLNLISVMAKGMGLSINKTKKSTDGINFSGGIGFIAHELKIIEGALKNIFGDITPKKDFKLGVATDISQEVKSKKLKLNLEMLQKAYPTKELKTSKSYERRELLKHLEDIFHRVDIFIVYEREVDTFFPGDSLGGHLGLKQNNSNKRYGKVCNMANLTAITIPDTHIGSGVIIMAKAGVHNGFIALELARELQVAMPELYQSFFKDSHLNQLEEYMFNLD